MKHLVCDLISSNKKWRGPDIQRIVDACAAFGYKVDPATAEHVWAAHSEENMTGWLWMPNYSNDQIVSIIRKHTREVSSDE